MSRMPKRWPPPIFAPEVTAVLLVAMGGSAALSALRLADQFRPQLQRSPAIYIAGACHALVRAITIRTEIVVLFARAVDPPVRLRRSERAAERERLRLEERDERAGPR